MNIPNNSIPQENIHIIEIPGEERGMTMHADREALFDAMTIGVDLNNEAVCLDKDGFHEKAIEKFLQALSIKIRAHGESSVHICISLSGLADAYRKIGDYDNALSQATRMMKIAQEINSPEQKRIAGLILSDVNQAMAVRANQY